MEEEFDLRAGATVSSLKTIAAEIAAGAKASPNNNRDDDRAPPTKVMK